MRQLWLFIPCWVGFIQVAVTLVSETEAHNTTTPVVTSCSTLIAGSDTPSAVLSTFVRLHFCTVQVRQAPQVTNNSCLASTLPSWHPKLANTTCLA